MNRKAPLLPIFNCKKRSREAVIAEPQENIAASSFDVNHLENSSNNAGFPVGNMYDKQMYDSSELVPSVNTQWSSGQLQIDQRMNNSNSRFQFQQRLPNQHEQMQGRSTASRQSINTSFSNQARIKQRSNSMELIPPNPSNPKSARYSAGQRSVITGGQGQSTRPSGRGNQGWGTRGSVSNTGRQNQTLVNNSGYGRNNEILNQTSRASALGDGNRNSYKPGSATVSNNQWYSYNPASATVSNHQLNTYNPSSATESSRQWNSGNGNGYTTQGGGGSMNIIGSGGALDSWNQWENDRQKQPSADRTGPAPVMDRRYAPIASSFQMPNATGEGWGPTNTNKGHESKTEWHPQAQVNKADPPKTATQSKPEPVQKPSLDRTLRIISTDLAGIKNWEHLRGTLTFLFEIYAQVNSATVKVPDTDGKKFNIKEGSISMDCIFYEIDHSLPKLTRGKLYRIVGSYDSQQNLIKCVAIREALQNEYAAHQQNVQKCAEYKLKLSNMVREQ
ncbi:uncharacterized protein LOC111110369 [Crassostrea virginica]